MKIDVAHDFSETPLGRYETDGAYSGERFRNEKLLPALQSGEVVEVEISGTEGYGSSFLEEAFGGLVRKGFFTADALEKKLIVSCSDPDFAIYRELIRKYICDAKFASS